MLDELPTDQVRVTIRHAGVGAVTDSDVHLADACNGIVVAFNVIPSPGAKKLAAEANVEIRPYRVIDQTGADALRWYLYTATRPGDARRFSIKLVQESLRRFFLTYWNTYSFFVTYANLDGFDPTRRGPG